MIGKYQIDYPVPSPQSPVTIPHSPVPNCLIALDFIFLADEN
ncbi:hypothetical protein [Sphaerospermopsis sp. LEGE 00249]|nr:hypothetical protein [Sphaerospermopsis sp. LEGE 00249]